MFSPFVFGLYDGKMRQAVTKAIMDKSTETEMFSSFFSPFVDGSTCPASQVPVRFI